MPRRRRASARSSRSRSRCRERRGAARRERAVGAQQDLVAAVAVRTGRRTASASGPAAPFRSMRTQSAERERLVALERAVACPAISMKLSPTSCCAGPTCPGTRPRHPVLVAAAAALLGTGRRLANAILDGFGRSFARASASSSRAPVVLPSSGRWAMSPQLARRPVRPRPPSPASALKPGRASRGDRARPSSRAPLARERASFTRVGLVPVRTSGSARRSRESVPSR